MNPDTSLIFDVTKLAEAVHEETDAGPSGADHLCESLLSDGGNQSFWLTRLAAIGHQQERPRQAPLTGVEKLINQIRLGSHAPS